MKKRFLVMIGVLGVFGVAAFMRPAPRELHRTEDWLEDATPTALDGFTAVPGKNGDKQTYRMSALTYETLQAYGIVTRQFTNHDKTYDVCVIAGNSRLSFHDPTSCFPSQDWKILDLKVVNMQTKTRGVIPVSLMHVQRLNDPPTFAVYTFKGPTSMVPSQGDLYMQWSLTNFVTGEPQEGAFYRFMAMDAKTTSDQLLSFVADYMDLIKKTSDGIL